MKIYSLITITLAMMLSACVSLNSVSLTPIPSERKHQVRTEKGKVIFLGFNFDNDFVEDAIEDLKRQCPNGKVTGLLTKDENIMYFLFFVWKKQVTATGYCLPHTTAMNTMKSKTRGAASADEAPSNPEL